MPRSGSKSSPSRPEGDRLEGRNVTLEALKAGRSLHWIAVDERARVHGKLQRIVDLAREQRVPVRLVPRIELDRQSVTGSHNGIIAEAPYATAVPLAELVRPTGDAEPCVVALGRKHGPEDVGAVIRTALAAGATAIVVPPGDGPALGPVARRVSMGAAEHVRFARADRKETSAAARKAGLRVLALATGEGGRPWHEADLTGPCVLLLDSESPDEPADERVALPSGNLPPTTIAAVLLYERERQGRAR